MRPPPLDRSRLGVLLRGHVAGAAAVLTAVVLTIGVPAGHRAAASMAASSGDGLLLPVGPGQDPAPADQPADATDLASPEDLTGRLLVDPAVDGALASSLAEGGIPATALDAYHRAADTAPAGCHVDWSLLAAIGRVESDHGQFAGAVLHSDGLSTPPILGPRLDGNGTALIRDTDGGRLDGDPTYDRAVGPMQFIPSTWAVFGRDGNGDGRADPFNIYDAASAAAAYLCAAGGDLSTVAGQQRAVLAYNHSDSYVAEVLALAAEYAGQLPPVIENPLPVPTELPPVNPGPPPALAAMSPAAESPAVATLPGPAASTTPAPSPSTSRTSTSSSRAPSSTAASSPAASSSAASSSSSAASSSAAPTTSASSGTSSSSATSSSASGSTSSSSSAPATTSSSAPPPTGTVCPVNPGTSTPITVDVVSETGDPAEGSTAETDIKAAGLTAGTPTSTTGTAASAIEYPAALQAQAGQLASDLGLRSLLVPSQNVQRITLVLGPTDSARLLDALQRAAAAPVCPAG